MLAEGCRPLQTHSVHLKIKDYPTVILSPKKGALQKVPLVPSNLTQGPYKPLGHINKPQRHAQKLRKLGSVIPTNIKNNSNSSLQHPLNLLKLTLSALLESKGGKYCSPKKVPAPVNLDKNSRSTLKTQKFTVKEENKWLLP